MTRISILIPTIKRDASFLFKLLQELRYQSAPYGDDIEILIDPAENDSIGDKRNRLLDDAKGEYLCAFDSDDKPSPDYIECMVKAVESGCDCAGMIGAYYVDGKFDGLFEHSIKYKEWKTNSNDCKIKYERPPNHLSLIRSSIAKQFKYPDKSFGEDHNWSNQVYESGLIKTEYPINEVIYHYLYRSNK